MEYFKKHTYINDQYYIEDIKEGGLGIVYLCHDKYRDEPIALKSFKSVSLTNWDNIHGNFVKEARTWIMIGDEPNVVQAKYILNIENGDLIVPYLALERIFGKESVGTTLREWIIEKSLKPELILLISIDICNCMLGIQKKLNSFGRDFVHLDLKPENILISKEGSIKITDFGLSRIFKGLTFRDSHSFSKNSKNNYSYGFTDSISGTPPYMSPEQCTGEKNIDFKSDIYSLGCVLFEMYTMNIFLM